ncbi:MAG: PorT family protein [Firmicutes bacterium]|nr:PorT family protein [Bacillota bacterium]MCM1401594.1 PorT family protein [Bacteroides sp.]MCM1477244.1 PorT family protein [Bacteroides sp.]
MLLRNFLFVILFSVLATLPPRAFAQRAYDPHFSIGGKAGVTFSNMSFAPSIEQSMLQGISVGAVARYVEEKYFGLVAELNIEQRGWKETFDETEFDYQRRLTYIQLPVMTHIYFGSDKFKGFFNLGPSVGYLISDSRSANFDYNNPAAVEGFPIANRHVNQMSMEIKNHFDYGICAGAGLELIIKRKHSFILEGRYYYGLGNIFSAKKKDEFSASRGTSIQVALGYMFHIK